MLSKKLKVDQLTIITNDEEKEEVIDGKKIKIIPIYKWLIRK